jgi:predicted ATPase/DNA-binding XRE family transcriptional regulator
LESEGRASGPSSFGRLLRHFRIAAGLSQEALAERAQMSKNGVSALERGYRRTPQRETLALLAGALALSGEQRSTFEEAAARWALLSRGEESSVTVGPWREAAAPVLPLTLTRFVGREAELAEIVALLREHRLVTVTGPGGVGKTQTALRAAASMAETSDLMVRFVALGPLTDPSLVVTAIAAALGLQEMPNHPLLDTLLTYLKNKSILLILDNCEHVADEAGTAIEALLLNCPQVRVLATSRQSLRVAGERTYRLPSLSAEGAIALFVDRALAADHRFTQTDESAPIVAELCRALDGIPLAIELAAARVNVLSVQALKDRLENRFRILVGGERKALPRQQTMRAAIDWSYELLTAREQRVFELLSVFAGGSTLGAAAAIFNDDGSSEDDVLDVLTSLVDKSLLVVDFDRREPRYRLLESFREYAKEKLAVHAQLEFAMKRHAVVCLELSEELERAFDSGTHGVWRALVGEEVDNWRVALQWALRERGDVALGQRLVGQLNTLWRYFARVEGRRWITLALQLVDDRSPPSVLAKLYFAEATAAWGSREYQRSLTRCEDAIAHYRAAGDSLGAARAQEIAALGLEVLGRLPESQALARDVLSMARTANNQMLATGAMRTLAMLSADSGDFTTARHYIADVLHIYELLGAKWDVPNVLNELACIECLAGNAELALQHGNDAFARRGDFEDPSVAIDLRTDMARYFIDVARYDEAKSHARETLTLARERHQDVYATFALQHLASIAVLQAQLFSERAVAVSPRAARILGFADARIAQRGSVLRVDERPFYERTLMALRAAIGAEAAAKLMAEGAAMTEEQAVEEALVL